MTKIVQRVWTWILIGFVYIVLGYGLLAAKWEDRKAKFLLPKRKR